MEQLNFAQLSKSFFMSIPEGLFLVSNVFYDRHTPLFTGYVVAPDKREAQWQRIKEAKADQRKCHVFPSKKDFKEWIRSIDDVNQYEVVE